MKSDGMWKILGARDVESPPLLQLPLGLDMHRRTGYGGLISRRHVWATPGMILCIRADEEDNTCDVLQGCG